MNVYILTFLKCLLPIPPPSKISILKRIPGPLGTFLITFIFTQIYSYCSQQFCKIISSLSAVMGEKKILFSWPNTDIIILMSSWDIAFLVERLHWFELVAIRFLLIFFNSNTWYWDQKKAKLTKFIELAILQFGCPILPICPQYGVLGRDTFPILCCAFRFQFQGMPAKSEDVSIPRGLPKHPDPEPNVNVHVWEQLARFGGFWVIFGTNVTSDATEITSDATI